MGRLREIDGVALAHVHARQNFLGQDDADGVADLGQFEGGHATLR
jgi:hypothetical protein